MLKKQTNGYAEFIKSEGFIKRFDYFKQLSVKMNDTDNFNKFSQCGDTQKIINDFKNERQESFSFSDERLELLDLSLKYLKDAEQHIFGLYGYAGTGKTRFVIELMHFLVNSNLIRRVAFTAPTHKAVGVLKSLFYENFPEEQHKMFENEKKTGLNKIISQKQERFTFTTIHKILGYVPTFTRNGTKVFKQKLKGNMGEYDVIIIDECSMIPLQMSIEIITTIKDKIANSRNDAKIPKIIFSGDPAQLPPVNENINCIFEKVFSNKIQLDLSQLQLPRGWDSDKRKQELLNTIESMPMYTLKSVFRNKDADITNLNYNVRQWTIGNIKNPEIGKFKSQKIHLYKTEQDKLQTKWFNQYVKNFKKNNGCGNIILTWTNKQTDIYNTKMRQIIFNRPILNAYENGDIIIFTDYYISGDSNEEGEHCAFYTSEQAKIENVFESTITIEQILCDFDNSKLELPESLLSKYYEMCAMLSEHGMKKYKIWEMDVSKINQEDQHRIIVIHDDDAERLKNDVDNVYKIIMSFVNECQYYTNTIQETVHDAILIPLWEFVDSNYVSKFAEINFGYSMTTHKAQGSTFINVFVDAHDILKNENNEEAKRCIYTAHTRSSNELHIMI